MLRSRFTIGVLEFRINWLIAACVLLTIIALMRLGFWQLSRAQEKVQQQRDYQAMQEDEATPIQYVPTAGRQYDIQQLQNRRVILEGEYLNERTILLVFQSHEAQVGYEVVTPFRADATDELVLVSRGWTPAADYAVIKERLPEITGPQSLTGQIYVPGAREAARENPDFELRWPLELRHLNMVQIEPLFEQTLFPYVVRLNEDQPGVLTRHWSDVIVDTSRNFSYALQWFSMAIAVLIVSLILCSNLLQLIRTRKVAQAD